MNTFLPVASFEGSARVLDRQRLGKQRVEAYQILRTLTGQSSGWRNHPAVRMWRGFEGALGQYGVAMCDEWILRGYKDTTRGKILSLVPGLEVVMPLWFGDPAFHASHRSNLLRKDADWYGQFGWVESPDLPYVWPLATDTP